MSLGEIRNLIDKQKEELKKHYKELRERRKLREGRKLIKRYKKLTQAREKVRQFIDIKKELKKTPSKKVKSFDEYFEECIRNRKIPEDTPPYLRKALERAILEYNKRFEKETVLDNNQRLEKETVLDNNQGLEKVTVKNYNIELVKEKSAFENFATKYTIQGIPGATPKDYFGRIYKTLRDFFENNRNIKFRINLVTDMDKVTSDKMETVKAYFISGNLINMKSTDVHQLIKKSLLSIEAGLEEYQNNGSDWRFKSTDKLEIHTVEYNPTKGSTYFPLPDWISNKKAIVNIQNKDEKCFLWCVLRYLHPKERDENRLTGLKEYEFSLNTKGITFPMKIKDITKFEKLNPELPGINVFSVDENKKFYTLRMAERDCLNTIDLFLYEEDGVSHYSLIKNFNRLIDTKNFE